MSLIDWSEQGKLPDGLIRHGIRRLCTQRLKEELADNPILQYQRFRERLAELRESPIAIETDAANEQHYEVPPEFFELALGKHRKYSSCYYSSGDETLDQAEADMLRLSCERAQLRDGQDILELGCGWGSLTLWMAEHYPNARITAISNSASQRQSIEERLSAKGLTNVEIITVDVNEFQTEQRFDRVVSIEMFEHMKNYARLMENISVWLKAQGKLFVHVFCHRELMYHFETEGDDNWLGRYFFTGGLMPAADTLLHFQDHLSIEHQWRMSGQHYERTSNHWLANLDRNRTAAEDILAEVNGRDDAALWVQRWRMFFMACAELFGYREGREWMVAHYLFKRR